jgi:hypothetical protein
MLRDKEQLIKWLITATQEDIVIRTALRTGRVEHLGVFSPLPSSERRGWAVRITTKHGHKYHLAVPMNQFNEPCYWYEVDNANFGSSETGLPRKFGGIPRSPAIHLPADRSPCPPSVCQTMDALRRPPKIVASAVQNDDK